MEKANQGRKYEGWFEKERCIFAFQSGMLKWVEVNLATLTYWGYNQILNICVSLPLSIPFQSYPYVGSFSQVK